MSSKFRTVTPQTALVRRNELVAALNKQGETITAILAQMDATVNARLTAIEEKVGLQCPPAEVVIERKLALVDPANATCAATPAEIAAFEAKMVNAELAAIYDQMPTVEGPA